LTEDRNQIIRENREKEKNRTVTLSIQIPADKYRRLQEMARITGMESLTFIKHPELLDCSFCPLGNDRHYCIAHYTEPGSNFCASTFYKFIFSEVLP
jgi:hypothetical protein